ncbi:MAG: energy transducer TonB [Novosphingobium sp.]
MRTLGSLAGFMIVLSGSAGAQDRSSSVSPPPSVLPQYVAPLPAPPGDASSVSKAKAAVPTGNPGNWVTTNDYPARALREQREGTVAFRVVVTPEGTVGECVITASSGSPDLDAQTCALMTARARFKPALDQNGKPTTGSYASRVRWIIPAEQRDRIQTLVLEKHPMPGQSVVTFTIGTDGRASNCVLVSGPNPAEFMLWAMPCEYGQTFPVYRDAAGQPIARNVRMVLGIG